MHHAIFYFVLSYSRIKGPKILRQQCESWSSTGDNSKFDIHTDVIKSTAFPGMFGLPKNCLLFRTNRILYLSQSDGLC